MAFSFRKFTSRSIWQRFALSIGTSSGAILIILAVISYLNAKQMLLQQTSNEALKEVNDQIHTMDDLVDRVAMLTMVIGATQIADEGQGGVTIPWLASLLEHCPIQAVYSLYMRLDNSDWRMPGRGVSRKTTPHPIQLKYDFHDPSQDWYGGARDSGKLYVTQPYFDKGGSDIDMISITQPVYNTHGIFVGVAGADVALDDIRDIVGRMHIRESGTPTAGGNGSILGGNIEQFSPDLKESAYLFTSTGTLISGPTASGQLLKVPQELQQSLQKILACDSGSLRINDGSGKILYWAKGKRTGWKLVLEVPYSLIVAPARDLAIISIVIGGMGLILLICVVLFVARRVSEPIGELQKVALHLEKGAYQNENAVLEKIGKRPDELGRFAKSFSAMAEVIQIREERLSRWSSELEETVKQRTADLDRAMKEVEKSNTIMASELSDAATYSKAMLPAKLKYPVWTDWIFESSSELGGDSFGYHYVDNDHFAIYLLDVCGHGVGAALLSVSVVNLLRNASLTETDFLNPSSVLDSLNKTFPMERHNDMYFTAWYGVYTYSTRQLSYACAGHPPAVLVNHDRSHTTLSAEGMIVGAFPSAKYETKTVQVPQGSRLYLFSDGAYEIDRVGKPMMSYDEFVQLLATTEENTDIKSIIDELKRQKGSETFADDVSLVVFKFDEADASAHNTRILLKADLSELDRLPGFLQGFCTEEKLGGELLFQLNLILEELATNVIKYGGVEEKQESCIIELSRNGPFLTIRFSDFGAPFNPLDQEEVDTNKSIADRPIGGLGIHFVRKLTDSQIYVREGERNVLTLTKLILEKA